MSNYFINSRLVRSDSDYEVYSLRIVDNFLKVLQFNSTCEMHLDFDYNVITLQADDSNRQVFNICVNEKDSNFLLDDATTDSNQSQSLIQIDRNTNQLINMGVIKNEKIIVKDNKEIESGLLSKSNGRKSQVIEKQDFKTYTLPLNRKRLSEQLINGGAAKKPLIDQNGADNDDVGIRSKTQPKVPSSFPLRKKIDVLNELQAGKSIHELSETFGISERAIRDFTICEKEIRQQFKELMLEIEPNVLPKPALKNANNSEKTITVQHNPIPKPLPKAIKKPTLNVTRKPCDSFGDQSKLTLNLDFEIHKEHGKLIFGKTLKKVTMNFQSIQLKLPKDHPDFSRPSPMQKKTFLSSVSKPFPTDPHRNSNLIPKIKPEPAKIGASEMSIENCAHKPPVTKSSESINNRLVKREPGIVAQKPISLTSTSSTAATTVLTANWKESDIKIVQHYPTDPIVKMESKLTLKKKSSTSQRSEPSEKPQSPFRYLIIDPSSIDFKPEENIDSEIRSTNIDSEEFINEVRESYDRFTVCLQFYDKYNFKREELRTRACAAQSEREISELYREFYRLVEEEKMPFFVNLEKEVTVLHEKLCKVANLMGIKLA